MHEPLIQSAVAALLLHHAKSTDPTKDLLGNDTVVQVQLGLEVAPKQAHVKPIRLDIPYGYRLIDADNGDEPPQVCLIVQQDSKAWVKELLAQFPEMNVVKKVLGLQSLRTKYGDFAQKRELLRSYNVFMADDSILPMLSKALGKIFFKAKQQPIPIPIARKSALPYHILKALKSTHLSYSTGTSITVVAGRTTMEPSQLVANIATLIPQAVSKLPRRWANIRSISLKTPSSMALPIYNKTPEELLEIARLANVTPAWTEPISPEDDKAEPPAKNSKSKAALLQVKREKSPLVRALTRERKHLRSEGATDPSKELESKNSSGDEKPAKSAKKEKKVEQRTNPRQSGDTKDDLQEKPTALTDVVKVAENEERNTKRKQKRDKSQRTVEAEVRTPKEVETEDPTVVKKLKKSKSSSTDHVSEGRDPFLPSKSYNGSKAGYVFKKGPQGVGYYVDVKPVVNRMALEAFQRMAAQAKQSSSSQQKKAKTGRRGRR